jgi:hypothetical protein
MVKLNLVCWSALWIILPSCQDEPSPRVTGALSPEAPLPALPTPAADNGDREKASSQVIEPEPQEFGFPPPLRPMPERDEVACPSGRACGPFSKELIAACLKFGGRQSCSAPQWDKGFFNCLVSYLTRRKEHKTTL